MVKPGDLGRYVYLQVHRSDGWHTTNHRAKITKQRMPDGVVRIGYMLTFTPRSTAYRTLRPATTSNAVGHSPTATIHFT